MKQRFEFNDDKSSKFWEIEIGTNEFTVCYGKIGTNGTTQVKTFGSAEETEKAANKLIAEKTKKGYEKV